MELEELKFSTEHVWVRLDDDNQATIGLTEEAFADKEEITKIKLPSEGDAFVKDETIGRLTTNRPAVLRLYAPVSGEVLEVNEDILDAPDMIQEDPYDEGWLLRVEISNITEFDDLMSQDEYEEFISEDLLDEDEDEDEDDEDEDYLEDEDEDEDEDY